MCTFKDLFPELALKLVTNLDEEVAVRLKDVPDEFKSIAEKAFRAGALMVLGDVIDLLKKYTDLHEE